MSTDDHDGWGGPEVVPGTDGRLARVVERKPDGRRLTLYRIVTDEAADPGDDRR